MLQTPEVAAQRIHAWFKRNPTVAETDANIAILTKYIREYFSVSGETLIDDAYLDLAYRNIGATMQHLIGPEVQQQIEQANKQALAAQQQLAEQRAEKAREEARLRRELERDARQDARRPGVSSAFADQDDAATERDRARKAAESAIRKQQRYLKFRERLSEANVYWEPNHAAKNDRKNQMFDAIRRDFPEFKDQVPA